MILMIRKNGPRILMREMGARGMRYCVNTRATCPRTQNKVSTVDLVTVAVAPRMAMYAILIR